ncbi:hypothetical protein P5G65_23705 [Paenibacillus chondroitinus]|uniref:SHOCT domain-containing protein n=2 Tax=Paenibacillus TaxID=44249 RepID=A0ABU6DHR8_9BACL|nr:MULTISPECIES: hypothetical protein [Paenibacillus]MCY9659515.1 hypothetical protein [Paenibacillus anseongense]MEB4796910.1 hypothetical protein [Paenibacillus chondroitinus]
MMIFGILFFLLIVGAVIFGIIMLFAKAFNKKEDPALHVLKDRFARGEINEEELRHKSNLLKNK